MDLSAWGLDARLIVRRDRPHPAAQLSMFDMSEGWRHTCFITNADALQIAAAERYSSFRRTTDPLQDPPGVLNRK